MLNLLLSRAIVRICQQSSYHTIHIYPAEKILSIVKSIVLDTQQTNAARTNMDNLLRIIPNTWQMVDRINEGISLVKDNSFIAQATFPVITDYDTNE